MNINIWICTLLLLGTTACSDSSEELAQQEDSFVTFTLNNHNISRSTAEDAYNENLIETVDLFFFKDTDSDGSYEDENYFLHHKETGLSANIEHNVSVPTTNLKTDGSVEYYIYAIINHNVTKLEDTDTTTPKTLTYLKELSVKEITVTDDNEGIQSSFVMDGHLQTTLTNNTNGVIPLYRSAAKITLRVDVAEEVRIGNTIYTPDLGSMTVEFINGAKQGVVNGINSTSQLLTTGEYSIESSSTTVTHTPFYSYPKVWMSSSDECYLQLKITWISGIGTTNDYYYHVPVVANNAEMQLKRNHHYMIDLEVAILGSIKEEKPVKLTPKYVVQKWNDVALDADLKNYRYLWVKEPINGEYWVMNNTTTLEIPYTSSHDCERTIVSCTQKSLYSADYDEEWSNNDFSSTDINANFYCALLDGKIVYKHNLDNNYTSSDFDFTPYDIIITIKHVNDKNNIDDELSETIIIKQYPAIYGEKDENTDSSEDDDNSNNHGYAFVNGYYSNGQSNYVEHIGLEEQGYFDTVNGSPSGIGVSSNSMLVFTITSPHGTDYIIGDPRERTVNKNFIDFTNEQNDASIWNSSPSTYGESPRILQYYYATETAHNKLKNADSSDESRITENEPPLYESEIEAIINERTYNMIAPKFRISSGYGAIKPPQVERQYYDMMKKRCASYQEDGYPAGRWRLPTMAEFRFIIFLSYHEKIPTLFSNEMPYWCAHGFGTAYENEVVPSFYTDYGGVGISVRCVYDDWYWGSDPVLEGDNKKQFTWGDELINR